MGTVECSRNVFSWKSSSAASGSSSVWKLFGKSGKDSSTSSPLHVVASSTALIQHPRYKSREWRVIQLKHVKFVFYSSHLKENLRKMSFLRS
jgi:hypothetical protein